jgi:mannose-6-phosphate isomerase-like protein (cupin superfamily)
MLYHRNELRTEQREKPRGGSGIVSYLHLAEDKGKTHGNIEMLAEMTLPPGASVGSHAHTENMEIYVILDGKGTVDDNGTEKPVSKGDVVITGNGDTHGIRNSGDVPLVLYAVIVKN